MDDPGGDGACGVWGGREVRGRSDGFCSFQISRGFNAGEPFCSSRVVAAPNLDHGGCVGRSRHVLSMPALRRHEPISMLNPVQKKKISRKEKRKGKVSRAVGTYWNGQNRVWAVE